MPAVCQVVTLNERHISSDGRSAAQPLSWGGGLSAHFNSPASAFPVRGLSHFRRVRLFATLWTVACQAPLSMGFSRQEYWSELSCLPPDDLSDPGIEPTSLVSPALAGSSLPLAPHISSGWWKTKPGPTLPSQPALGLSDATKTPTLLLWEQACIPTPLLALSFLPGIFHFPLLPHFASLLNMCFLFFCVCFLNNGEKRIYSHLIKRRTSISTMILHPKLIFCT